MSSDAQSHAVLEKMLMQFSWVRLNTFLMYLLFNEGKSHNETLKLKSAILKMSLRVIEKNHK